MVRLSRLFERGSRVPEVATDGVVLAPLVGLLGAHIEDHTDATRVSMTLGYRSVDDLARSGGKSGLVLGVRVYRGNDGGP